MPIIDGYSIPYGRVPKSTPLQLDYLYQFDRLARFYSGSPYDWSLYSQIASQLPADAGRRAKVAEVLERQNLAFGAGELTQRNINRLRDSKTVAVVTGQQVGLFAGPAYTLYKALTTIWLADHLTRQGLSAVPVFWLVSEDHDWDEVAETAAFDAEYRLVQFRVGGQRPSERVPVGQVTLGPDVEIALDQLEKLLLEGPSRVELLHDLQSCYQPGVTWSAAFARFLTRLLKPWGVILVDQFDASLHELCYELFALAIHRADEIRASLQDRSRVLEAAGYHAQVRVADDDTTLFVLRDGRRLPLHQVGEEVFQIENSQFSARDIKAWLAKDAWQFSPNVLLRPVMQDSILPTIAYVGGPAEIAYLAQAQAVYRIFGRAMPMVFPRLGITLVDRRGRRLLEKYQLSMEDIWQGEEHLGRKLALSDRAANSMRKLDQAKQDLGRSLAELRESLRELDSTLVPAVEHAEQKSVYQLERLQQRIARAALQNSELLSRHRDMLSRQLWPEELLQERVVGSAYFLGRAGYDLLEGLLAYMSAGRIDHQVVFY